MDLTYAAAGDLLDRFRKAWLAFDGDAWADLFSPDVVYHDGPFDEPLVGRNALRAYLLEATQRQDQLEVVIERHWRSHGRSSPCGTRATCSACPEAGSGSRAR